MNRGIHLMKKRRFLGLLLTLGVVLGLDFPAHAVAVCYDYAIFRVSGTDPRPIVDPRMQGTTRLDLVTILKGKGYAPLPTMLAASDLKAGDVIFTGRPSFGEPGEESRHVGYVEGPNSISHFLQVQGTSTRNVHWDAANLPRGGQLPLPTPAQKAVWGNLVVFGPHGGWFPGDTLPGFLEKPEIKPTTYEVWRGHSFASLEGIWRTPTVPYGTLTITSQQPDGTFIGRISGNPPATVTGRVLNDTVEFHALGIYGQPMTFKLTLEPGGQLMQGVAYFDSNPGTSMAFSAER
jgi:hypothetical protein